MFKNAFSGSASRSAHSAACLLLLLLGIAESALLLIFTLFIARNNPKLDNFQNAIIDPIGIRWIVAITVMGGCVVILAYIQMWMMQASRARGRRRRDDDFEWGDVWHHQSRARQTPKQQKQSKGRPGPGSHFQRQHSPGTQDQGEPYFGATLENLQKSAPRRSGAASYESDSNYSSREASPARPGADLPSGSGGRPSSSTPGRVPSYKTIRSMPTNPEPAYREDKFYHH